VISISTAVKSSALFCLLIITSTPLLSSASECRKLVSVTTPEILTKDSLKLMAWNLNNVFTHQGEFQREGMKFMKRSAGKKGLPEAKPLWEVEAIRTTIATHLPDFATFTEVENVYALRKLLEDDPRLKGIYDILLKEGNDQRGIDIATVVKKSLGLRYKLDTHKDLEWTDRFQVGKQWKEETGPIFARDLPAIRLYRPGEETPFLILIGNHGKSKRDREGDPESNRWRTVQYEKAAEIIKKYKAEYPRTNIIMAGDFNTDVMTGHEMRAIRDITKSAFDLAPVEQQIPPKKRSTHAYFAPGGGPSFNMIDDVRILGNLEVMDADILPLIDRNGKPMPPPKTFKQRENQPSDHNPLLITIKNKK